MYYKATFEMKSSANDHVHACTLCAFNQVQCDIRCGGDPHSYFTLSKFKFKKTDKQAKPTKH